MIDPTTLTVIKVVKTPQIQDNHPLAFAVAADQVIVGGKNGVLSAYTPSGVRVGDVAVQHNIDQCSTGAKGATIACAGKGVISVIAAVHGAPPTLVAKLNTGHTGIHTVGIDESTGNVWVVWSDAKGDWVQRLRLTP